MAGLARVTVGVCAVAVIAGGTLAGCGAAPRGSGPPRAVTLPRVSCGSAVTRLLDDHTKLLSASPGTLPCFDAAVRNCRSASISVTAMGVDAGTRYVFVIEPGTDPCQVTEQSQSYMVSGGLRHGRVTTVGCERTIVTVTGVMLRCGGRNILIPAEVSMSADGREVAS